MLEIIHHKVPFEHFIMPNFFDEEELKDALTEINFIEKCKRFTYNQHALSSGYNEESYLAKRKGIFLEKFFNGQYFRETSLIYRGIKKIYRPDIKLKFAQFGTFGKLLSHTNNDSVLISRYYKEDYYKPHFDTSLFTLIVYLCEDNKYTGGDIVFSDYNYKIKPVTNLAILFPGQEIHEVLPIIPNDKNSNEVLRTAISMFIFINHS